MSEPTKLPDVFQTIFDTMPGIPKPKPKERICRLCGKPITALCNQGRCDQ